MMVQIGSHFVHAEKVANISPSNNENSCFINFLDNKEIWVKADISAKEAARIISKGQGFRNNKKEK